MELLGPDGRPLQLPLDGRVSALERNLQITFNLVEQLRMELLNQALKTQFMVNKLAEKGVMSEDVNTEFQEFVKGELKNMEQAQNNKRELPNKENGLKLDI